jgi:hypothetical protein
MPAIRPSRFKGDVSSFHVSEFAQSLPARLPQVTPFGRRERKEVADLWNSWLLLGMGRRYSGEPQRGEEDVEDAPSLAAHTRR